MMATASGTLSETREKNLPPLSPNIEASQLLTPLQLARITIDNPHYQDHLMQSMLLQHQTMGPSVPTHQHVLKRRTAKLGDNYFFLQKDIPVSQMYARTALKLSDVRPWDQIVDRPLNTQKVIDKEVHLPFPQEHPYTSHISRFAVFPDTNHRSLPHPQPLNPISPADKDRRQPPQESTYESSNTNGLPTAQDTPLPRTASVQTQTALTSFKPLAAYYVPQKAGEWGLRVEEHHLSVPGIPSLSTDVGRTFWDLPRSRQHRRANTYPAPRFFYSAQLPTSPGQPHTTIRQCSFTPPTTANPPVPPRPGQAVPRRIPPAADRTAAVTPTTLGPPPSSSLQSSPPITPQTNEALNSIHRLLTRTTTYGEHFPGQTVPSNHHNGDQKNILRLDYSLRSCVSQRPWTSESRGKYCRRIPMSPRMAVEPESDNISEADSADGLGDSDGIVFSLLKGAESHKEGVESHGEARSHDGGADPHKAQNDAKSNKDTIKGHGDQSNMVDSSTQTEEEYFITTATPNAPLSQLRNTTLTSTAAPQLTASQSAALAYKLPQVETTQSAKKVTLPSSKEDAAAAGVQPSLRLPKASSVPEPSKLDASQLVRFPSAKRPLSAFVDTLPTYKTMLKPQHTRSYSADASYSPHQNDNNNIRTAQSTRRLMTLYNGFTRSAVMKKFHEQYPEKAPDLREYSIREGKRHVISGSHAYYFH